MVKKEEAVERQFYCTVCKKKHKIQLDKSLLKGKKNFPFSYLHLHGKVDDVLSTLYLDANLNIRGAESVKLDSSDNIFSQEQAMEITKNLMAELSRLQHENHELRKKLTKNEKKKKK
ncbi:MAG: hypothetical protein GY870_06990 [archaeon]|nr:hypothetical protein [archaeon]